MSKSFPELRFRFSDTPDKIPMTSSWALKGPEFPVKSGGNGQKSHNQAVWYSIGGLGTFEKRARHPWGLSSALGGSKSHAVALLGRQKGCRHRFSRPRKATAWDFEPPSADERAPRMPGALLEDSKASDWIPDRLVVTFLPISSRFHGELRALQSPNDDLLL